MKVAWCGRFAALAAMVLAVSASLLAACSGGGSDDDGGDDGNEPPRYAIGGTVQGLPDGRSVVLSDGNSQANVGADGTFTFPDRQIDGTAYRVALRSGPTERFCVVSNGVGIVDKTDVANVQVDCTRLRHAVPNDMITATALSADGTQLYFGGTFTRVGLPAGNASLLARSTGAADLVFPTFQGKLRAAIPDGAGGWYLGGEFATVNDQNLGHLIHVLADRTVDEHFDGKSCCWPNSTIAALALSRDKLMVATGFSSFGQLAIVDAATGTQSRSFEVDGLVTSLVAMGEVFYVGGEFRRVGGHPRSGLAAFFVASGDLASWNPAPTLAGQPTSRIHALAASTTTLYVSGAFDTIAGVARGGLAALDTSGHASAWDPHCAGSAQALAIANGSVYLAGDLVSVGGAARPTLAAVDAESGAVKAWDPGIALQASPRFALAATNDTIYVAGSFDSVGGLARNGVAALDAATAELRDWGPDLAALDTIFVSGEDVLAGSKAPFAAGKPRAGLASISLSSGALQDWDPRLSMDDPDVHLRVEKLVVDRTRVIAAGHFDRVNGVVRKGLAFIDGTTGVVDPSAPPPPEIAAAYVSGLSLAGSTLYFAGWISMDGREAYRALAIDTSTGQLTTWRPPDANGWIFGITTSDSAVHIGGGFEEVGGLQRKHLAAFDKMTGQLADWSPVLIPNNLYEDSFVYSLHSTGPVVYVGGLFDGAGDQVAYNLVALDSASGAPLPGWAGSTWFEVRDIINASGNLFAGGAAEGESVGVIARRDLLGNELPDTPDLLTYGHRGSVDSMTVTPSTLIVAGDFDAVDDHWRPYLTILPR